MASLFADENFPAPASRQLRKLGHDVITCGDVGMSNRRVPDEIVLAFATRLGRTVLTLDGEDFVDLHQRGAAHCGIVACADDPDSEALAQRIHAALSVEVSLAGRLIQVRS